MVLHGLHFDYTWITHGLVLHFDRSGTYIWLLLILVELFEFLALNIIS